MILEKIPNLLRHLLTTQYACSCTVLLLTRSIALELRVPPDRRMHSGAGQRTVPSIFVNGQHIGGCDDTVALHESGWRVEREV